MRVVANIPHHTFGITVFHWNAKYIFKIEWGVYEQVFKVDEEAVQGLSNFSAYLTDDFLRACMLRFKEMHSNFTELNKNQNHE